MSMSKNQWVHQKYTCMYKENYTTLSDSDFFKESETYMLLGGAMEVGEKKSQLGDLQEPIYHYQDT